MDYPIINLYDSKKGLLMHRFMIILSVWAVMLLQLNAEDARDKVREEILKSFDEANHARAQAVSELDKTVKNIEEARAQRADANLSETAAQTKIVESEEVAKIAQSVAKVEIAKVNAKEQIVLTIIKEDGRDTDKTDAVKEELKKAIATQKITKAIVSVEIAKAKAAKTIIKATQRVELAKTEVSSKQLDDASALTIAKNNSAVQIAKSVSAVEIAKSVSEVQITQALIDEDIRVKVKKQYRDMSMDEIKAKASAEISTIMARVEVDQAKALADIAKIVSFVKIAEAINAQDKKTESQKMKKAHVTYPKKFRVYKAH